MDEYEKYKALIEAEQYSKKNMGIEKQQKKKKNYGCLVSLIAISFLFVLFYIFIIYYRHHLFVELGL